MKALAWHAVCVVVALHWWGFGTEWSDALHVRSLGRVLWLPPLHPWEWPQKPWMRVHAGTMLPPSCSQMNGGTLDKLCNFACEDEEHLLLPLDYRSSWWPTMPRVLPVQNSNSLCRVMECTTIGLAEWPVQTFKSGMKNLTEGTLETRLSRFLFHYCTTPDATTGQLPEGGMAVQPGWQPIKRAVIAAVVVNRMRSIMNLTLQIAAVMNIELLMWQKQNRAVLRNCTRPVFVLLRSVPRKLRNRPGARALVKHGSQRGANRSQQLCPKPLFADGRKASQL